MRDMGGLCKWMPHTYRTFIVATAALIGLFPLVGFWSKDEILAGVSQLGGEGNYTAFMIVGVVGALQFDVIEARLQSEYGIQCRVETLPYTTARWPEATRPEALPLKLPLTGVLLVKDLKERDVLLFQSDWELRYCADRNPEVLFHASL
jgi:peptide chain release factor 3